MVRHSYHRKMHCEAPMYFPIIAYPKAWSPSTNGTVSGEVIYLDAASEEELEAYRGKLKGKFVFLDTLRALKEWEKPLAERFTAEELLKKANAGPPTPRPGLGAAPLDCLGKLAKTSKEL